MRNLIVVLLLGALSVLGFADVVARPVVVERPPLIEHVLHRQYCTAVHVDVKYIDSAAILVASVATPLSMPVTYAVHQPLVVALPRSLISVPVRHLVTSAGGAPPIRYMHRWRKRHGRWYRFTYRIGRTQLDTADIVIV